jgi:hypothetical protein
MNYYFEQLRHHLRQGDQRSAFADAMTMWENKIPNGVILPSENTDWTAHVADECIVDTWALAKISSSRSGSAGHSQSRSSHPGGADCTSALIVRLQDLGVQAIIIQIKLVDARYNVVLGEFYDPENFCSHFIWFPISHLSRLDYPLPPRSIGLSRKTVTLDYLKSINNLNSLYARKTLIKFFSSYYAPAQSQAALTDAGEVSAHVAQPGATFRRDQVGELQFHELISWSVQEEFSGAPFNGWLQDLNCALSVRNDASSEAASMQSTEASAWTGVSLPQLVKETSDKIIMERLLSKESSVQQGDSQGE